MTDPESSRKRLKEHGIEFPHLVVAVTPDGQVIWQPTDQDVGLGKHSNVSPDGLRSFGNDLIKVAERLEVPSAANDAAD
ncbi:hypothetical protein [Reyranella soli]|uniref:Uncharacterized protein n=1 Tax=Reyranella soli TaxID=1230389 RepID=A0A512NSE1_9HYPH|nr:hypothetical protein [Reyranella soli]GEP61863.1 hypothetical protein RSO01_90290 [Reyranella soli]